MAGGAVADRAVGPALRIGRNPVPGRVAEILSQDHALNLPQPLMARFIAEKPEFWANDIAED